MTFLLTYRKYVEVLYKCKPVSFRSRVVCGGEGVALSCPAPATRLAVFSATFSGAGGGHVFCPASRGLAPRGGAGTCDVAVTGAVSALCHGYLNCSFPALPGALGVSVRGCGGAGRLTLKVTTYPPPPPPA